MQFDSYLIFERDNIRDGLTFRVLIFRFYSMLLGKFEEKVQGDCNKYHPPFVGIELPYRVKLCRAKVTNFLKGDENFDRQSFAQQ